MSVGLRNSAKKFKGKSSKQSSYLSQHCSTCGCPPIFFFLWYVISSMNRDKSTRELIEALHIRRYGDRYVSAPFIIVAGNEYLLYLSHTAQVMYVLWFFFFFVVVVVVVFPFLTRILFVCRMRSLLWKVFSWFLSWAGGTLSLALWILYICMFFNKPKRIVAS